MVGCISSKPYELGWFWVYKSINREFTERSLTPHRPLIDCRSKCSWGALLYCMSLSMITLRYLPRPSSLANPQGCGRTKHHPRLRPRCWSKLKQLAVPFIPSGRAVPEYQVHIYINPLRPWRVGHLLRNMHTHDIPLGADACLKFGYQALNLSN